MKVQINNYSSVFILTDENVAPFWLPEVCAWLHCPQAIEIVIKSGEQQKNLRTVQRIWNKLLKNNADRHSLLINLGGGMVSDLGGFAASCFKRGIDFINIPTTLLAMVDASIGGKTGIDFGGFKNQIGVFSNPKDVLVNPVFLRTLPQREILSGLAEMLKCGFIADSELLQADLENYESYIHRAAEIKKTIVAEDPFEQGKRKILNFGHTIGHVIEAYFNYEQYSHGEAVAIGMYALTRLTVQEGITEKDVLDNLAIIFDTYGLPYEMPEMDMAKVEKLLSSDKKFEGEIINLCIMPKIGKAEIVRMHKKNALKLFEKTV